ncbi:hypothetical protein KC324_g12030 [Hortaea werneckii]|nr:hypothetical protein KC324_g12030 [Hortaea werneckii]
MEHSQAQNYDYPSLEQIANEVLDMNGRVHEDYIDAQLNALPFQRLANGAAAIPNYHSKPDGSVDSAVSLPNSDSFENSKITGDRTVDDRLRDALAGQTSAEIGNGLPAVAPSVETNGASQHSPIVEGLPLYRPPAPLSQSPEQSRRQPATAKIDLGENASQKRNSQAPSASPNAKRAVPANGDVHEPSVQETEDERLAREMHSDDLGLRRRPSRQ